MKYNYKDHSEIDPLMNEYILSVNNVGDVKEIPIQEINVFLNELEEWYAYMQLWESQDYEEDQSQEFWEHYCNVEQTTMGVGKDEPCNWCGETEGVKDAHSML